ncbi:MAG TPA: D-glycero-beta-D-manno-heptose-7-phosphate kinase, partial [candidate division Zixibacteria bacterium]|nr:D-glycero-beta-D-manno-heptose-7-phosphate kinase [candidate division Zixibacteria bacterium]
MPIKIDRIDKITGNIGKARILILGDIMLDEYLHGQVNRISPEAPVPVVEIAHEQLSLGGAANVANNIVSLGNTP